MHKINHLRSRLQRGISLIESLVAIVVMALGILGILGVQMRTLADTQTSVRRAQAIRLIEDLSERIKANPDALGSTSGYTIAFGGTLSATKDCAIASGFPASNCTATQIAAYDRARWVESVRNNLPLGDANVFVSASDARQLGVMMAWRENERDTSTDYKDGIDAAAGSAIDCPNGKTCHLQYIPLNQRCLPWPTNTVVYCAE